MAVAINRAGSENPIPPPPLPESALATALSDELAETPLRSCHELCAAPSEPRRWPLRDRRRRAERDVRGLRDLRASEMPPARSEAALASLGERERELIGLGY